MYLCQNCGAVFEVPDVVFERHGLDTPPYEALLVCPSCRDSDITEARECDCCREWVPSYYETEDERVYCKRCIHYRRAW